MKKWLILALALTLALSLAACGGADNSDTPSGGGSTPPPASQGGNDTPSGNGTDTSDLTTVEGLLTAFGLTEDDLKCANFTRLDKDSYSLETGEIGSIGVFVSKKLTDEDVKAWLDQVLTKLNALSDNGKIKNILSDGDLTTDYIMSQTMYMGTGTYTYNGKKVTALLSVTPGYLDDEDPNEAMAACSLSLEFD